MMLPEFYIEVELERGLTRVQVEAIAFSGWDMPGCPQFIIEYFTGHDFFTLTVQLENGTWYDRNTRLSEDEFFLRYFELGPEKAWDPAYESPLSVAELKLIGNGISNYMVVMLSDYMGLFVPQYRTPTLN